MIQKMCVFDNLTLQGRLYQTDGAASPKKDLRPSECVRTDGRPKKCKLCIRRRVYLAGRFVNVYDFSQVARSTRGEAVIAQLYS